jgi:hypothetical protein
MKKETAISKPTEGKAETKPEAKERKISKSAERKKAKKAAKQLQKQQQQQMEQMEQAVQMAATIPEMVIPTAIQMTPMEPTVLLSTVQTRPLEDRKEVVVRVKKALRFYWRFCHDIVADDHRSSATIS